MGFGVHVLFSLFSDIGISAGVVVKEVEDCYKEKLDKFMLERD